MSRIYGGSYLYLTLGELIGFAGMTAGGILIAPGEAFPNRAKTLLVGLAAIGALGVGLGRLSKLPLISCADGRLRHSAHHGADRRDDDPPGEDGGGHAGARVRLFECHVQRLSARRHGGVRPPGGRGAPAFLMIVTSGLLPVLALAMRLDRSVYGEGMWGKR